MTKENSYFEEKSQIRRFDSRWMTSLSHLQLPVLLLWGDDDAVAPMTIPNSIATIVPKERLTFKTMSKTG